MDNTDKDPKKKIDPNSESKENTDPQENMEGPISSLVQGVKESGEDNDKDTKEEADRKKEKNT